MRQGLSVSRGVMSANRAGFTLMEILIAGAIFAFIAMVGTAALASIYSGRAVATQRAELNNAMRSVLDDLTREIHIAQSVSLEPDGTLDIVQAGGTKKVALVKPTSGGSAPGKITLTNSAGTHNLLPNDISLLNRTGFPSNIKVSAASSQPPYVYLDIFLVPFPDDGSSTPIEARTIASPRLWK